MIDMEAFDGAADVAGKWVAELMRRLGWLHRDRTCAALIVSLHALRDSLPGHEAIFLGDQLPHLLRGLYYEGWRMSKYSALKTRESFLERIRDGLHRDPGIDAEQVTRIVLALLAERLPAAELEDLRAVTPKALRALWPA